MKDSFSSQPIQEIMKAVRDLGRITNYNQSESVPNIQKLDVVEDDVIESKTPKILGIFKTVFPKNREKKQKRWRRIQKKISQSVETLQRYSLTIQKLHESGTEEEKNFAKEALKIIHDYNQMILKSSEEPSKVADQIEHFLYDTFGSRISFEKYSPILLPKKATFETKSNMDHEDLVTDQFASHFFHEEGGDIPPPSEKEKVAFLMKTISLTNKSDLPKTLQKSISDHLRNSPIRVALKHESTPESGLISMQQILTPFPGETIVFHGDFKRDSYSSVISVPIPESFRFSTKSEQTGFPHPSLSNGWALTDDLFPSSPHYIQLIPNFFSLLQKKDLVAKQLLPDGTFNLRAKHILNEKTEAFSENISTLLPMHKNLSLVILEELHEEKLSPSDKEILDSFFSTLKEYHAPYQYLSRMIQMINKSFIERPHRRLIERWTNQEIPDLESEDEKIRYQTAFDFLSDQISISLKEFEGQKNAEEDPTAKRALEFCIAYGVPLANACRRIILQHLSEKISFPPPMLTLPEHKLQVAAIKQQLLFFRDLENPKDPAESLEDTLHNDMRYFQKERTPFYYKLAEKISHELEVYFNTRHYQRQISDKHQ